MQAPSECEVELFYDLIPLTGRAPKRAVLRKLRHRGAELSSSKMPERMAGGLAYSR